MWNTHNLPGVDFDLNFFKRSTTVLCCLHLQSGVITLLLLLPSCQDICLVSIVWVYWNGKRRSWSYSDVWQYNYIQLLLDLPPGRQCWVHPGRYFFVKSFHVCNTYIFFCFFILSNTKLSEIFVLKIEISCFIFGSHIIVKIHI